MNKFKVGDRVRAYYDFSSFDFQVRAVTTISVHDQYGNGYHYKQCRRLLNRRLNMKVSTITPQTSNIITHDNTNKLLRITRLVASIEKFKNRPIADIPELSEPYSLYLAGNLLGRHMINKLVVYLDNITVDKS